MLRFFVSLGLIGIINYNTLWASFDQLPNELVYHIGCSLNYDELLSFRRINKQCHRIAPELSHKLFQKKYQRCGYEVNNVFSSKYNDFPDDYSVPTQNMDFEYVYRRFSDYPSIWKIKILSIPSSLKPYGFEILRDPKRIFKDQIMLYGSFQVQHELINAINNTQHISEPADHEQPFFSKNRLQTDKFCAWVNEHKHDNLNICIRRAAFIITWIDEKIKPKDIFFMDDNLRPPILNAYKNSYVIIMSIHHPYAVIGAFEPFSPEKNTQNLFLYVHLKSGRYMSLQKFVDYYHPGHFLTEFMEMNHHGNSIYVNSIIKSPDGSKKLEWLKIYISPLIMVQFMQPL